MGKKVLLIQHDWFGGMMGAGGLTNLDLYYPNVQGGIWWQMFQTMALIEGMARAPAEEDRHQSSRTMYGGETATRFCQLWAGVGYGEADRHKAGSLLTLRWREMDSNYRSPV
jgi:hypothetical protein